MALCYTICMGVSHTNVALIQQKHSHSDNMSLNKWTQKVRGNNIRRFTIY